MDREVIRLNRNIEMKTPEIAGLLKKGNVALARIKGKELQRQNATINRIELSKGNMESLISRLATMTHAKAMAEVMGATSALFGELNADLKGSNVEGQIRAFSRETRRLSEFEAELNNRLDDAFAVDNESALVEEEETKMLQEIVAKMSLPVPENVRQELGLAAPAARGAALHAGGH